jgi:molybdopterin-guanine dinucleotide biosynthesis protein A
MPDVIKEPALAAAILAGGQARRLGGANKAALEIGGVRILDRQLAVLRDVASTVFLVGGDSAQVPSGLRVVPDAIPGAGTLGGIYTAIVESPCDRTIVVGCDMPFLSAALFRRMAAEDADLVIPRSARGYEPLCAVYGRSCAAPIRARIDQGALQAAVLPGGMRVKELGPEELAAYDPDGLLFVNVNTPHDYERAKALMEWKPNSTEDRSTTD